MFGSNVDKRRCIAEALVRPFGYRERIVHENTARPGTATMATEFGGFCPTGLQKNAPTVLSSMVWELAAAKAARNGKKRAHRDVILKKKQ